MKKESKTSTDIVKRNRGRPSGSKDKKKLKRKTRKTAQEVIKGANRILAKHASKKEEEKCNIKIVAVVVKADGNFRFKIKREKMPEVVPAEELVFKITYERNGVPLNSVIKEVRRLAEALIQSIELHQ